MKTKAITVTAPKTVEMVDVTLPSLSDGEVLVKTVASCISPGTELRCMSGEGEASLFPYIPGYCQAGIVMECGPGTSIPEGTRVFSAGTDKCSLPTQWGAHIAHAVKDEKDLLILPDNLEFLECSAARLAAIAHHGTRFSQPNPGKTVAVIGLGPIGQLSARIHHAYGCDVVGGDILDTRVNLLQSVGARSVNTSQGVGKAFAGMLPEGADVLVDATGVSALIRDFLKVAKELPWNDDPLEGCRYILQGSYAGMVEIPYLDAFMKEVNFFLPRNLQRGDMEAVLKLMAEGRLDTRDLIDQVYLPEQAVEAYARVSDPAQVSGTLAFNWEEDV